MPPKPRPPFPWKCRRCQGFHVFMAKIDYDAKIKCGGYLHKFTVHDLEIPVCGWCGEKVFTEKVDEQIQKGLHAHLLTKEKPMKEYFATCDVQGPISVRIMANSLEEVLEQIALNGQAWIDDFRCDAEDAFIDMEFDDDWENYGSEDIEEEMKSVGYQCAHDSGIQNNWVVWAK